MRIQFHQRSLATTKSRRGALSVLAAFLMIPLIIMLAYSIDIGYLLKKRAELQRAADAAVLASVRDLVPDSDGNQNLDQVRSTLRQYASNNILDVRGFTVLETDIKIGRLERETVYSEVTLLDDGILDAVRVTLRRDASANEPIRLLFGGVLGIIRSEVRATATAVLQKPSLLRPGAGVLPFSIPQDEWNATQPGQIWSIYGDGRMVDGSGQQIPGNWGTLNLGPSSNSTAEINDQILNGLQQSHLSGLHAEGRIPSHEHIDSSVPFNANADPGLSAGMKSSLEAIKGQSRLIPIYDSTSSGGGNNLEFHVSGWAVATLHDSNFSGSKNTYVQIKKSFLYDGVLRPNRDLSKTEDVIEGAYSTPVLIQ